MPADESTCRPESKGSSGITEGCCSNRCQSSPSFALNGTYLQTRGNRMEISTCTAVYLLHLGTSIDPRL
ncbi:hypothetical protein KM043_013314 [Ampulex compressa]|nr:hypothetical protein KM043_013314 [Ampulex compressa]